MRAENEKGSGSPGPFLLAAQRLVACGCNVIPVNRRDKKPATRWERFQTERLLDQDADKVDAYLHSWWGRSDPYNLAVVTGEVSGVAIVDVDSLAARLLVTKTIGCWPRTVDSDGANHPVVTPTATTPNDGWHIWFRHPPGMRNVVGRGGEKLDGRGDGGYAIVPPSSLGRYGYQWGVSPFISEGGVWPPMPMPDELRELLWPVRPAVDGARGAAPILTTKYIDVALEREVETVAAATEGSRNDALNRAAFSLARFVRDGRLPANAYVEELSAAARRTGLPETEIRATLTSALRSRT